MKKLLLALLIGSCSFYLPTSFAAAQPFHTGYVDNAAFYNVSPTVGHEWMKKARANGTGFVRLNVYWDTIAPSVRPENFDPTDPADPAYDWGLLDQALKSARANRLTPMLMAFLAPSWAEGPNRHPDARMGTWKPDPAEFAKFGKALARRYNGTFPDPTSPGSTLPKVRYFQYGFPQLVAPHNTKVLEIIFMKSLFNKTSFRNFEDGYIYGIANIIGRNSCGVKG